VSQHKRQAQAVTDELHQILRELEERFSGAPSAMRTQGSHNRETGSRSGEVLPWREVIPVLERGFSLLQEWVRSQRNDGENGGYGIDIAAQGRHGQREKVADVMDRFSRILGTIRSEGENERRKSLEPWREFVMGLEHLSAMDMCLRRSAEAGVASDAVSLICRLEHSVDGIRFVSRSWMEREWIRFCETSNSTMESIHRYAIEAEEAALESLLTYVRDDILAPGAIRAFGRIPELYEFLKFLPKKRRAQAEAACHLVLGTVPGTSRAPLWLVKDTLHHVHLRQNWTSAHEEEFQAQWLESNQQTIGLDRVAQHLRQTIAERRNFLAKVDERIYKAEGYLVGPRGRDALEAWRRWNGESEIQIRCRVIGIEVEVVACLDRMA